MTDKSQTEDAAQRDEDLATLVIPAQLVEKVVAYLAELAATDDEVSGFMLGRGVAGSSIGSRSPSYVSTRLTEDRTGTNCYYDSLYGWVCQDPQPSGS